MSYADAIKKQAEAKPVAPKPAAEPVAKKPAAPVAAAAPKAEKKKVEKKAEKVEEEAAPKVAEEAVTLPLDIGVAASPWTAMARKPATVKPAPVPEKAEKKKAESEDRAVEKAEKVEKAAKTADDCEVKASKPRREAGERSGKKAEKKSEKKTEEKPAAVEPEVSKPLEIAAVPAAGAWGKATIVSVIAAKKAEVVVAPTPAPKKSRKGAAQKEAAPAAAEVATEVAPAAEKADTPVVEEVAPVAAATSEETKSSEVADDASLEIEGTAEVVEIDVEARALPQTPLSEADAPIAVLEPLHKDGDARVETPVAPIAPVAVSPVKLSTEQDQQLQKGTTVTLPVGHQKFVQPAGTFTFIGTLPAEPVAAPVEAVRSAPIRTAAAPVSSTPAHHQTAAPHYSAHNNSMNTYHNNAVPAHQYNAAPQQHQPAGVNAGGGYNRNGTMYFDTESRQYNNNTYNNAPHAGGYQGHNNVSSIGRGGYRGGYHSDVPRPNYEGGRGGGYEGRGGGYNAYRGGGGAPRYEGGGGYYPAVQNSNSYNSAPVHHNSHHDVPSHQQYNSAPTGGYHGSRYNNNMAPPAHSNTFRGGTNYPMPSATSYTRGRGRGSGEPSAITNPGLFNGGQQYNQDYHQPQQYGGHHHPQHRAPQYSSPPPPNQGYGPY